MVRRSNDKAKLSHIERRYFVAPTAKAFDGTLSYGDWRDTEGPHTWYSDEYAKPGNILGSYTAIGVPFTLIDVATGGDYSGNLVEKSNARCLKADFPWLVEVHGGYGTFGVGYLGKRENQNDALIEAIDSLTEHSLYSEDDHSALEMETADTAWSESYGGRCDWARALAKHFDEIDEDHAHEIDEDTHATALDELWYDCIERFQGGEAYLNESGDSIYFPIDRVIEKIGRNWPGLDDPHYSGDRPSIRVQLASLLPLSRVKES